MDYWENITSNHADMSKEFPSGKEGMKAVQYLASFFKQHGCNELTTDHPLMNRLSVGSEPNYRWLIQYSRKLITASLIDGFHSVAKRFSNPSEYLSAHNEMEVALKLHLGGLKVAFSQIEKTAKPDLYVMKNGYKTNVEVTSLNPPEEERLIHTLYSGILVFTSHPKIIAGGLIAGAPSDKERGIIIEEVKKAREDVIQLGVTRSIRFPGIATIYLAPRDNAEKIPEECRDAFSIIQPNRRAIEDLTVRKMKDKYDQVAADSGAGLLYIYTEMADRQKLLSLFETDPNSVDLALATYPQLQGLVLTVPHRGIHVVSAVKSSGSEVKRRGNNVFFESSPGEYQGESTIMWVNSHAAKYLPEYIKQAIENYSSNLRKLSPL